MEFSSRMKVRFNNTLNVAREKGITYLMVASFNRVYSGGLTLLPGPIRRAILNKYAHTIKSFLAAGPSVLEILDFSFSPMLGLSLRPFQIRDEITQLLELLQKKQIKTMAEIGTANGGTLFLFSQVASEDARILSIDLPEGPFGGGYPEWKIPLYLSFARAEQRIHLLREDSHDPGTLNKVKSILGNQKLDFLFIDGDHSYEGVKKDFEMYSSLVRKGGIIAFHDIVVLPPETGDHVNRFWNEIKYLYNDIEIVEDWNQRWGGVGVLFV